MKKQVKLYMTTDGGGAGGRQRRNAVKEGGGTLHYCGICRMQKTG